MTGEIDEKPSSRAWETDAPDSQMRCYLGMKGRITVAELISHFAEKYPHVDPMTVELNYSTAAWTEPPTVDDIAQRESVRAWKAERQESWERQMYAKLKAKFEGA
jgi:hypothetical protein